MKNCWITCPRCQCESYEVLKSYAHCCACNYSPEFSEKLDEPAIPQWVYKYLGKPTKAHAPIVPQSVGGAL